MRQKALTPIIILREGGEILMRVDLIYKHVTTTNMMSKSGRGWISTMEDDEHIAKKI